MHAVSAAPGTRLDRRSVGLYDDVLEALVPSEAEKVAAALLAPKLPKTPAVPQSALLPEPTAHVRHVQPRLTHQQEAIDFTLKRGGSALIIHPTGAGKAQPLDATVWTPSGPKRMGEIRVGDEVCTPDGGQAKVSGVFPQGVKDIFRVMFSDGSSAEACGEHLWRVHHVDWSEPRVLSTEQVASRRYFASEARTPGGPRADQDRYKRQRPCLRMRIDVTRPVMFDRREVTVDPYLLGVLLGDGHLRNSSVGVTTADIEILGEVSCRLPPGVNIKPSNPPYGYSLTSGQIGGGRNQLVRALRRYGLLGKRSEVKEIPDDFLFNDIEVRRAVLQGLMDTDGTVSKRSGQAVFYSTSKRLAEQVVWLVQSLGGIARLGSKQGRYRKSDGTIKECLRCYRVAINIVDVASLFRLSRKRRLAVARTKYTPKRFIRAVEFSRRAEAQCIKIDHPDHLYLTDGFVVTHNSRTAADIGEELRRQTRGRTLYVTPASLRTNMAKAVTKWTPRTKVQIVREAKEAIPKGDAAVVSYELFKRNGPLFAQAGYDTVVFDEIQKAKDPATGTYQNLIDHRKHFRNYVGFTASLNSLSPVDMLQPISAITGGRHDLGDPDSFKKRYLLTRGDVVSKDVLDQVEPERRAVFAKQVVGFRNSKDLGQRLRKYIHYVPRDKLDPKLFPKKKVETVEIEMSDDQTKLYKAALKQLPPDAIKILDGTGRKGDIAQIYNSLIQARALSGGVHTMVPGLSLSASARLTPKASKVLDDIDDHLDETRDGQVIVTTNLVNGGIDVLSQGLKDRGVPFGVFMGKGKGQQTEEQRQQALKDYNAGKLKVLLVSPAGHEGLDAPNTTFLANYDAHFNPEHVLQSEARGIRAGGQSKRPQEKRQVIVRRYVSVMPQSQGLFAKIKKLLGMWQRQKTVDQKIYEVAAQRHRLNQSVFDILQGKQPGEHEL